MFAHFTQETGGHNPHADEEEWRQVFKTVHQVLKILLFVLIIDCPKEYFIDAHRVLSTCERLVVLREEPDANMILPAQLKPGR